MARLRLHPEEGELGLAFCALHEVGNFVGFLFARLTIMIAPLAFSRVFCAATAEAIGTRPAAIPSLLCLVEMQKLWRIFRRFSFQA